MGVREGQVASGCTSIPNELHGAWRLILSQADRAAFKNKLLKGQRQDHIDTLDGIDKDIQANKLADTDIQPQAE